jgi:hypothetical protein
VRPAGAIGPIECGTELQEEEMNSDDELVSRILFHPRGEDYGYRPQGIPTETHCGGEMVCGYLHENCESYDREARR